MLLDAAGAGELYTIGPGFEWCLQPIGPADVLTAMPGGGIGADAGAEESAGSIRSRRCDRRQYSTRCAGTGRQTQLDCGAEMEDDDGCGAGKFDGAVVAGGECGSDVAASRPIVAAAGVGAGAGAS